MKLTSERSNGIKTGYWSPARKDDLVQRLGAIEHEAPRLLQGTCIRRCPYQRDTDRMTGNLCGDCEVYQLAMLIGGVE